MPRSKSEIIEDMIDVGLSDNQIRQAFNRSQKKTIQGFEENIPISKRIWEGIRLPEQFLTQFLTPEKPMTALPPSISPSIVGTVASGIPSVLEQSGQDIGNYLKKISPSPSSSPMISKGEELVKNILPSFVSRGSLLTAGGIKGVGLAGKYAVKPILEALGPQLESLSGGVPGQLKEAYKSAKLIFSKGTKAATPLYEAGKKIGGEMNPELSGIADKLKFVEKASELAESEKLNPTSALEARKELDKLRKRVTGEFFRKARNQFDTIAKKAFSEADPIFKKGLMAEGLRKLFPQNKYGGASAFKTAIAPALTGLGGFVGNVVGMPVAGATVGGAMAGGLLSPLAQGIAATGAGLGAKAISPLIENPVLTGAILSALKNVNTTNPVMSPISSLHSESVQLMGKALTESKIKEYLKIAKNDKRKARALAIKDGYNPKLPILNE